MATPVNPADVRKLVDQLPVGVRLKAGDLHKRYARIASAAGRAPGHPVALGQQLRKMGMVRGKIQTSGVNAACWTKPETLGEVTT